MCVSSCDSLSFVSVCPEALLLSPCAESLRNSLRILQSAPVNVQRYALVGSNGFLISLFRFGFTSTQFCLRHHRQRYASDKGSNQAFQHKCAHPHLSTCSCHYHPHRHVGQWHIAPPVPLSSRPSDELELIPPLMPSVCPLLLPALFLRGRNYLNFASRTTRGFVFLNTLCKEKGNTLLSEPLVVLSSQLDSRGISCPASSLRIHVLL